MVVGGSDDGERRTIGNSALSDYEAAIYEYANNKTATTAIQYTISWQPQYLTAFIASTQQISMMRKGSTG